MTTTETPWERLARIAEARRKHLRMSQPEVTEAGGPSVSWQTNIRHKTEDPGVRHKPHLTKLDAVMLWEPGTSMRLLTEDRSGWSVERVVDREFALINGKDRIGTFATMIEDKLRTLNPQDAEMLIRRLAMTAGLPIVLE